MHKLCGTYGHSWQFKEQGRQECLRCHDSRTYTIAKGQPVFAGTAIAPVEAPPVAEADAGTVARAYLASH